MKEKVKNGWFFGKDSPEKNVLLLYCILLQFHASEYKDREAPLRILSKKERGFVNKKKKEVREDGEGRISFRFFQLIVKKGDALSQDACVMIHFCRYKNNSLMIEELKKVGSKNNFLLIKKKKNLFILKFEE